MKTFMVNARSNCKYNLHEVKLRRICRTVFRNIANWNLEFWGQMTGWLDFRVGKVFEGMDGGLGTRSFGFESHERLG